MATEGLAAAVPAVRTALEMLSFDTEHYDTGAVVDTARSAVADIGEEADVFDVESVAAAAADVAAQASRSRDSGLHEKTVDCSSAAVSEPEGVPDHMSVLAAGAAGRTVVTAEQDEGMDARPAPVVQDQGDFAPTSNAALGVVLAGLPERNCCFVQLAAWLLLRATR